MITFAIITAAVIVGGFLGLCVGALLSANHQLGERTDEHEEFPGC